MFKGEDNAALETWLADTACHLERLARQAEGLGVRPVALTMFDAAQAIFDALDALAHQSRTLFPTGPAGPGAT